MAFKLGIKAESGYQKYFQGYVFGQVPKKTGKGYRSKRFYIGNYWCHAMDRPAWVRVKMVYSGLLLLAVALFVLFSLNRSSRNTAVYVSIPGCLSLLSLLCLISSVIFYVFCPRRMTVYEQHRSHRDVQIWGAVSSAAILLTMAGSLIHNLTHPVSAFDWFSCGAYLLSAACTLAINLLELRMEYAEEPNTSRPPFRVDMDD